MSKGHSISLLVGGAVALFIAVMYVGLSSVSLTSPFAGESTHDFEVVEITDQYRVVQHTFELSNVSTRTIRIRGVTSSCGCAASEPDKEMIEPAGVVRVRVSLTLADSGPVSHTVWLHHDGARTSFPLRVRAMGRRPQDLIPLNRVIDAVPGEGWETTVLLVDYTGTGHQQALTAHGEGDLSMTVGSWTLIQAADSELGVPARWQCTIEGISVEGAHPRSTTVRVRHGVLERSILVRSSTPGEHESEG